MKIRAAQLSWTATGCLVAFVAGTPTFADDTELLLIRPDPSQNPTPNVMFVLDTSGSMTSVETTKTAYDSSVTYAGSCDSNAIYWSEFDVVPDCTVTNKWVWKTAFNCDYATRQIDGIGSYTNTMVQYRAGNKSGGGGSSVETWNYLEPGNATAPVECQADSGIHGDGTAGYLWAAKGSGLSYPFTDDPQQELSWGSAPRNLAYTFYDGNYLNWKTTFDQVDLSRTEIMKSVVTTVMESVQNVNVGIMRFNGDAGGTVLQAVKDLDTNRSALVATVAGLPASGSTPLSESLYENARYWSGLSVDYGLVAQTDPAALDTSAGSGAYVQPPLAACAKNYNVLLSDGQPNKDEEGATKAPTLPDWTNVLGYSGCDGANEGLCLDDIAEYLSKVDTAGNLPGTQSVTTFTIGYSQNIPIMEEAAVDSGGTYFRADNLEELTLALLSIVSEINERALSFSAPAVSVNTFNRTRNLNDIYMTVFAARPNVHWPGNLKKYGIDGDVIVDADGNDAVDAATGFFRSTARSYWTTGTDGSNVRLGGAARQLPPPANRNLYTNNGSVATLSDGSNAISTANATAFTLADFGLSGAAGEPTKDEIIDWLRGVDVRDEDGNPATTVRYAMGDPLHSQPAAVVYGGTDTNPDVVVFTATNDGYVHAVDAASGREIWSFIPKQLLTRAALLYFNPSAKYKDYGMDGDITPVVRDVDGDGQIEVNDGDFIRLVMGMRRGGSTYYALDVTRKYAPKVLWTRTLDDGGQSWSTPVVTRMNINTTGLNNEKAVVVIGGGYDSVHDTSTHPTAADAFGAGIHILDLDTGNTLWRAAKDTSTGASKAFPDMKRAFPTQIRVIDLNGDTYADRMYAADMGGQIWRFDVVNGEAPASLVDGGVIAQLGADPLTNPTAAQTRRFYNSPDVSMFRDPVSGVRYLNIGIGSGYRAHPFDTSAADRFFSLRDPAVFNRLDQSAYDNYDVIEPADLVEVSGSVKNVVGPSDRGWMFTLPGNEKILAGSVTFNDEIFFVSFDPDAVRANDCGTGQGTNFLYRVSVTNGDPIVNNLDAITPGFEDEERREQLAQGGIAPSPTILFPSPDPNCTGNGCSPPPIMCIGVECSSPGFRNRPVRTLWTEDGAD